MTHIQNKACAFLFVLPIFAFAEIEPKRPLSPQQELQITQDSHSVIVSGETFSYTFSRENGLISAVRVMGQQITDGTPIPDLVAAEQLNPDDSPYAARRETRASLNIRSASPSQVVVVAEGRYTAADGRIFPLRYSISYEISIDGVVLVAVTNTALDNCSLRWLTLSGGAIRSELVKFLNWMPEQSTSQSTRYQFRTVAEISGERLLAGTWIPWFWLGDQNVGLEVTTWDVGSQTF